MKQNCHSEYKRILHITYLYMKPLLWLNILLKDRETFSFTSSLLHMTIKHLLTHTIFQSFLHRSLPFSIKYSTYVAKKSIQQRIVIDSNCVKTEK